MQRAHCSPVTLDRRNPATLHRPQSWEMLLPPKAESKDDICSASKNTRLGKEEAHFKPKDDKTPAGSAHTSPEGQAAPPQCRNLPAESQLPSPPPSFLWPPFLPHYVEQIQQPKGDTIHHRGGGEKNTI